MTGKERFTGSYDCKRRIVDTYMKKDILICGVGGQGTVLASKLIAAAAMEEGNTVHSAETIGMAQRGGSVTSHVRIGEAYSPLIPKGKCDMILAFEPAEAVRNLPYLKKEGWIITNTAPFVNIPNYPELDTLMQSIKALNHHVSLDVDKIAKEVASPRCANIVLLGAASPFLGIEVEKIEEGIRNVFGKKGDAIVEMNLKAFRAGLQVADEHINK